MPYNEKATMWHEWMGVFSIFKYPFAWPHLPGRLFADLGPIIACSFIALAAPWFARVLAVNLPLRWVCRALASGSLAAFFRVSYPLLAGRVPGIVLGPGMYVTAVAFLMTVVGFWLIPGRRDEER